ncbi:hypothetical protein C9I98_08340 [Photobacterium sanctipauli]|uniref:Chromosome partitioning protein ParA n=1 Tax=Photobacterium sanctipauli TaxID=1342794 RepID=A0A2T3NX38_9GAMM|nr:hypothetical protein [Photobacterium sanctipauli]PSW20835.1 hypothetical protein C9I98_08340 [Photobacterium sanctipauli]
MKKINFLAASVALVLSGCNSSSTPSPEVGDPTITSTFIDSPVEGMVYTTSSGEEGVTDSAGEYTAKASDTITFYLGGKEGLKVGAASNRDVLTPFEAAGKYNRAVNLAVILQSLNNEFGSGSSETLFVPEKLRDIQDPQVAEALANLSLDSDYETVKAFLTSDAIGVSADNVVEVDEALEHMDGAFGDMARGGNNANPFTQSGKFVRSIDVTQYELSNDPITFVHADKMLDNDLFEKTRGMKLMNFETTSTGAIMLAGSNDTTFTAGAAEDYLTCIADYEGEFTHGNPNLCDGNPITPGTYSLANYQNFDYNILNPYKASTEDEELVWDEAQEMNIVPFVAKTVTELNHYTANVLWDDGEEENGSYVEAWQLNTTSGSYDPVTGVYTEIVEKTELNGEDCDQASNSCTDGRKTQRVAFYYEVGSEDAERYVDFKGTWHENQICTDGQPATMQYVFDDKGLTTTGTECINGTPTDIGSEFNTYADLANIDYWWFNQAGRESKATLTELNTVVRFCDEDNYQPGNSCDDDQFFVKFEYQPAGADWDEGLLIRTKMDTSGNQASSSIMQKVQ